MKKCLSCGYEQDKNINFCPVCESPLVFENSDKKKIIPFEKYFVLGIILVSLCVLIFFIMSYGKKAKIIPKQKLPVYPYEEKIEKSIKALSAVIIPDYSEQEVVFTYLENGSANLKLAACETLIYWAAYSKTSRQLYLKKAAQPLYTDFEKKQQLIDIFNYFLSMKVFFPQELNFMMPQLSSMACSKDYKTAQKALRLVFMIDENANLCRCCKSLGSSFADFDVKSRDICVKSCLKVDK